MWFFFASSLLHRDDFSPISVLRFFVLFSDGNAEGSVGSWDRRVDLEGKRGRRLRLPHPHP